MFEFENIPENVKAAVYQSADSLYQTSLLYHRTSWDDDSAVAGANVNEQRYRLIASANEKLSSIGWACATKRVDGERRLVLNNMKGDEFLW